MTDDELTERQDGDVELSRLRALHEHYLVYIEQSVCMWIVVPASMPTRGAVVRVMRELTADRVSEDGLYMELARQVARRATCLSRRNGSVLVSAEGHVIATGYNGPPTGVPNPTSCPRLEAPSYMHGGNLDVCGDAHAEENCIAQAARHGASAVGGTVYTLFSPCNRCARMLLNTGITDVVYEREYGDASGLKMVTDAGLNVRRS